RRNVAVGLYRRLSSDGPVRPTGTPPARRRVIQHDGAVRPERFTEGVGRRVRHALVAGPFVALGRRAVRPCGPVVGGPRSPTTGRERAPPRPASPTVVAGAHSSTPPSWPPRRPPLVLAPASSLAPAVHYSPVRGRMTGRNQMEGPAM